MTKPTTREALRHALDRALPLSPKEAVLRKLVGDVRARKQLLDSIRKEANRPPRKPVGPYLKKLGQEKGRLSRDLALLRRADASAAAIKTVEDQIKSIQDKITFWPARKSDRRRSRGSKSPYWIDEETLLFALHGLTKKPGPGNRDYLFEYIKECGRAAVAELIGADKTLKASDAARSVVRRLNLETDAEGAPLIPARKQGLLTYRSLRPASKKRAKN